MRNSTQPLQFFSDLEPIRGIAALTVALFHVGWMFPLYTWGFIRHGYLMVDVFFVLSGFVICHSYGQKILDKLSLGRFMWLRLGRVYPLHFAILLAFVGIELSRYIVQIKFGFSVGDPAFSENNLQSFFSNLFLVHSLGIHDNLTWNHPSWTISLEFYTYLLFGLVALISRTRLMLVLISIGLISSSLWVMFSVGYNYLGASIDFGFFRSVLGFFLGVLTYQVYLWMNGAIGGRGDRKLATSLLPLLFSGSIVLLLTFKSSQWFWSIFLPSPAYVDFIVLGMVPLLILSLTTTSGGPVSWALNLKPFIWLGKVSYSVYMVHYGVIGFITLGLILFIKPGSVTLETIGVTIFDTSPILGSLLVFATVGIVLIVSHFTHKWIEEPFRKKSRELADIWLSPKSLRPTARSIISKRIRAFQDLIIRPFL